ncbi:MAG TPA: HAMP domain-containing sensor histidine kinase, partial [Minicystis sp.]|nr:HAMP domain-containing sensor histidine kinase [Minicystis sp.]
AVDGSFVRFTVSDAGPGVAGADRERVFERHVRGAASRGSGLGLFIARSIVLAHGGRIWIETAPSGGASVCFTLPLAP